MRRSSPSSGMQPAFAALVACLLAVAAPTTPAAGGGEVTSLLVTLSPQDGAVGDVLTATAWACTYPLGERPDLGADGVPGPEDEDCRLARAARWTVNRVVSLDRRRGGMVELTILRQGLLELQAKLPRAEFNLTREVGRGSGPASKGPAIVIGAMLGGLPLGLGYAAVGDAVSLSGWHCPRDEDGSVDLGPNRVPDGPPPTGDDACEPVALEWQLSSASTDGGGSDALPAEFSAASGEQVDLRAVSPGPVAVLGMAPSLEGAHGSLQLMVVADGEVNPFAPICGVLFGAAPSEDGTIPGWFLLSIGFAGAPNALSGRFTEIASDPAAPIGPVESVHAGDAANIVTFLFPDLTRQQVEVAFNADGLPAELSDRTISTMAGGKGSLPPTAQNLYGSSACAPGAPTAPADGADLDGDGDADPTDVAVLFRDWGRTGATGELRGDMNGDGTVDGSDYLAWRAAQVN